MEELLVRLAKELDEKRYGKYRGIITDNKDPDKKGRLKIKIPVVLGDQESDWALPCLPFGGLADQGLFFIPEIDSQVWVEFEEGDIHRPIWTGTFWQKGDDVPKEGSMEEPTTRILKTPGGHILQFDDKSGEEQIILKHKTEAVISIDKDGTILVKDKKENTMLLDADSGEIAISDSNGNSMTMTGSGTKIEDKNGNSIDMAAAGITLKGQQIVLDGSMVMLAGQGGEPIIKGQSFITYYMTHMHPSAMGPTGPPIPQGEMSTLSMKVTTA